MKNYKPLENGVVDPYMTVMKKESGGYHRIYGRDVINKLIKKVGYCYASYMILAGLMESFISNEFERYQLIAMRKEIQKDHEKKNWSN